MIRNWFLFGISLLLLPVVIWFFVERISFLSRAERVEGWVGAVRSYNGSCSSGSRRSRRSYPCTKFDAQIEFVTKRGEPGQFEVGAGSSRGHNEPISRASYRKGETVPVLYDPTGRTTACRDTFADKWGYPFMALILQIVTFFGSLFEGKKRSSW